MKKFKFLTFIFMLFALVAGLCACDGFGNNGQTYEITLNTDLPYTLHVGDEVDFTVYFIVKDQNGTSVPVNADMLDLSNADTSMPGAFTVTLTIGKFKKSADFIVLPEEEEYGGGEKEPNGGETNPGGETDDAAKALSDALKAYGNRASWNFAVTRTETYEGTAEEESYETEEYYEYFGYNILNTYTGYGYDDNDQYYEAEYTDYLVYDGGTDKFSYYSDMGDGTFEKYAEGTDEYDQQYSYLYLIDFAELKNVDFTADGTKYSARNGADAAKAVLGEYSYEDPYGDGSVVTLAWTSLDVYLENGRISKIAALLEDGTVVEYAFSKYGAVDFTPPSEGSEGGGETDPNGGETDPNGGNTTPGNVMEKQTYNASSFDSENLQDKLAAEDVAIGLSSVGTYNVLVIPVQFSGETISQTQLGNLKKAFNGTEEDTGWESVRTYYQKSSYGKLNLTFDIQDVYQAKHNASYYENYSGTAESYDEYSYTRTGYDLILTEALDYYQSKLDLSRYDHDGDNMIDGVYLIYSHSVEYTSDSFFWALTTWFYGKETYDNLGVYYYMFAGIDFMEESTAADDSSGYEEIPGLKINAITYIHESGHMLGLDDYYDYAENTGSDEGLGGADMMDSNMGDHCVYSKTMLGWLSPTIVTETQTVTLKPSVSEGSAILIPLDFDNSYFGEYLMVDLYAAEGLNKLHSQYAQDDITLYGGEQYGVRIYHVSSSIEDPFSSEDYPAITDYNNSLTDIPLIKLVAADGKKKFSDSKGYAAANDLWKAGKTLSDVFADYTRNDKKKVNFDIQIVSATADSAEIKITFNN